MECHFQYNEPYEVFLIKSSYYLFTSTVSSKSVQVPEKCTHRPYKTVVLNSMYWFCNIFEEIIRLQTISSKSQNKYKYQEERGTEQTSFLPARLCFCRDFSLYLDNYTLVKYDSKSHRSLEDKIFS